MSKVWSSSFSMPRYSLCLLQMQRFSFTRNFMCFGSSDAPVKCVNCSGDHPSSSKQCPKYQQEQEIIKLKYTLNIPFPEALKRILSKPSLSYAHWPLLKPHLLARKQNLFLLKSHSKRNHQLSLFILFQKPLRIIQLHLLLNLVRQINGPHRNKVQYQLRQYLRLLNHLKLKEI